MRRSAPSSTCCLRSRASASTTRSSISRPPRCRSWTAAQRRSCSCSQSAGIEEQGAPKRFVRVRKRVEVGEGDKWVRLDPHDGFRVNVEIDFDHPALRKHRQSMSMDFSTSTFLKEISRARTFGFLKDLETLAQARPRARRQPRQRDRDGRLPRVERGRPALPRRVRAPQGARRARRPLSGRRGPDRASSAASSAATGSTICCCGGCSSSPSPTRKSCSTRRWSSARRSRTSSRPDTDAPRLSPHPPRGTTLIRTRALGSRSIE